MDYDVTKISPLQLDKRGQIEWKPHRRQTRLQCHLLIILLHNLMMIIKCKITIFCPLSFGYRYERSWDILFQLFLKRSIQKIKYGLAVYLTKVPVRLFRLLSAEGTFSKDDVIDDDSDRLLQYYYSATWRMMIVCQSQRLSYLTTWIGR